MTLCTLSLELMEKASERVSSDWAWAGGRVMERVRPRGERLGMDVDVAVLGVRGTAVRGVVGKTAVAGTSFPSLWRRRSSLVRRSVEDPDAVEELEMIEGAMESTEPRWWYVDMGFVSDTGESTGEGEGEGESLRSGGR